MQETSLRTNFVSANNFEPEISVIDNVLADTERQAIHDYLQSDGWKFGWKSDAKKDHFSFWHKHFAGSLSPDHYQAEGQVNQYCCEDELQRNSSVIYEFWQALYNSLLRRHRLVRCYANGSPYGSEGSLHTDSRSEHSYTAIYYSHQNWLANWGGETVFFNAEENDIIVSVFPKPNRLLLFNGAIPHVARGVSRSCPLLRITLMFKTEVGNHA